MPNHDRSSNGTYPTCARAPFVAAALALLLGAPAWGVAVSVTVTGSGGEPLASAEVDLGFGDARQTDEHGRTTLVVPDDQIGRETEAVISFDDPRTGERRTERQQVTIAPDLRISLPQVESPTARTRPAPPGRDLGCNFAGGGFQIGLGAGTGEVDETPVEEQSFEFVFAFASGTEIARESGTKSDTELAELNRVEKKKHEMDELGPVSVRIPLFRGSCRDGSRRFVPSLRLGVGQVDATLTSTNVEMPGFSQSFSGDGWMYEAGFDATLFRSEKRCLYNFGIEHRWTESIDVRRSVDLASTFDFPGFFTIRDDLTYEYEATSIRLTAGHAGDRFVPYGGFRYTWFEASLVGDSRVDISSFFPSAPPGTEIVEDLRIRTLFEDDYVEAVAGVIARLSDSLALRGEGAVGENTFSVSASAVLSLGR